MKAIVFGVLLATASAAACASNDDTGTPSPSSTQSPNESDPGVTYPEGCEGLKGSDTAACGEAQYWRAMQKEKSARVTTHDLLGRLGEGSEGATAGRLHFLRGTLAMALALEDGRADLVPSVLPDLRRAWELEHNPKYPSWVDSMEIVTAFLQNDRAEFDASAKRSIANVELYPVGNILSITGTLSGFPLSTGLPQKAVELLERWRCDTDWCAKNTARAPYSQPGIAYHFADAYARVGNVEKARFYLEKSLAADRAGEWPYRAKAAEALADVPRFVSRYTELGNDKHAIFLVYANSREGCVLCHGARP